MEMRVQGTQGFVLSQWEEEVFRAAIICIYYIIKLVELDTISTHVNDTNEPL